MIEFAGKAPPKVRAKGDSIDIQEDGIGAEATFQAVRESSGDVSTVVTPV